MNKAPAVSDPSSHSNSNSEAVPGNGTPVSHFSGQDRPGWELYSTCVHCGLCLNHCPTYRVLGTEMDSPRGRIYQVLQVDSGRLEIGEPFVTHIDRCLDCRACESACPSGVPYGRIVERTRAQIENHYRRPWLSRTLRRFFYLHVLKDLRQLRIAGKLLRFYQRSGLQAALRATGVLRLLGVAGLDRLAPPVDRQFFIDELGNTFPARGEKRGRVALHGGCVAGIAFSELNRATIRVLQQNGIEVVVPKEQQCCGALLAHAGFRDAARELARKNIDVLLEDGIDVILTNTAGCGSTLKEYQELLRNDNDPAYSAKAELFSRKMRDVTEYLAEIGIRPPQRSYSGTVTYQDPCHLAHGQRVRSAPRELIRAVGAKLKEMPRPDSCCGSAGSYNITQHDLSMKILERKMDDVASTDVPLLLTANTGCMLQLRAGIAQRHLRIQVKHVIELLDEVYRD